MGCGAMCGDFQINKSSATNLTLKTSQSIIQKISKTNVLIDKEQHNHFMKSYR